MGQQKTGAIRWLRPVGSLGAALSLAVGVTFVVMTTKHDVGVNRTASVINSSDQVAADGLTVQVMQSDTSVQFVPPLDGNPFTREWFHSVTAGYRATGPKAKTFAGHIAIGYLVGYPASFNGRLSFGWRTPSLNFTICPNGCGPGIGDLVPQLGVDLSLQQGPGIQSVVAAQGDVQGPQGEVRVNNLHGTVTGVMGPVNLRPYVTIQVAHGDEVTTYGPTFTH